MTAFTGLLNIFIRYFNSHAHVERDGKTDEIADILVNFNSHAHVERDLFPLSCTQCSHNFNSHAHVERDLFIPILPQMKKYFNSHAHVERDATYVRLNFNLSISTHTLTWSVTNRFVHIISRKGISTHTLTWSVTCDSSSVCRYRLFQLTRSRGA